MDTGEARQRFGDARVARLATVGAEARPHLVPITFVLDRDPASGADLVVSAVDAKPKRSRRLRRLANVAANSAVCLLVDHYEDDWDALWWVRADGVASVEQAPPAGAGELLAAKYVQYREQPPEGPFLVVRVVKWRGWSAS